MVIHQNKTHHQAVINGKLAEMNLETLRTHRACECPFTYLIHQRYMFRQNVRNENAAFALFTSSFCFAENAS